ncbi:MAG: hypothetical protein V3T83_08645 [Acidobacteriota bacterium]
MTLRQFGLAFLIGALILIGTVLCLSLVRGELTPTQAWFSLVLVVLSGLILRLAPPDRSASVACWMLLSLAALFSRLNPSEVGALAGVGPSAGWVLEVLWTLLMSIFPFVFLHFALTFPVTSRWVEEHPSLQFWIYLPVVLVLFVPRLDPENAIGMAVILPIPVGFLLGLYVQSRQYRHSLTGAEKNRLRVVLIGGLAGGLPRLIAAVGSAQLPPYLLDLADILLPLFPLSLAVAVLKESFFEIGLGFQRVLVYSLAGTGTVNVFFAVHTAASFGLSDENSLNPLSTALAGLAALAVSVPLRRWAGGYVQDRFEALQGPQAERHSATDPTRAESDFRLLSNPYVVGNPVRSEQMFFGRREEFEFIRRRLVNEREGCAIVLCGDRRTGKTSILYQILNGRLGGGFVPVFLDMQGLVVNNDREFAGEVVRTIGKSIEQAGWRPKGNQPIEGYLSLTGYIESLLQQEGFPRLLLLIDEYELIDSKVERGKLSSDIYPYLNSLLERFSRLSLVLTGSRPLQMGSPWERLLSHSAFREVSFLSRSDARDLLTVPLQGQVQFRAGTLDTFWRLARGSPFFTQLLGQTLVDVLNERRSAVASPSACQQTVQRVLENPPPQLLYRWSAFSDSEKLILSALATLLKRSDAFLPPQRAERLLRSLPGQVGSHLDGAQIRMALEALRQRSVLDRDQTRYRFTMDLMRLWIRAERNIWNVLNEIGEFRAKPQRTQS